METVIFLEKEQLYQIDTDIDRLYTKNKQYNIHRNINEV